MQRWSGTIASHRISRSSIPGRPWTASSPGVFKTLINRRQLVKGSLAVAASTLGGVRFGAARAVERSAKHVLLRSPVPDLLAEESLAGFRSVMPGGSLISGFVPAKNWRGERIVVPSAQALSREHIDLLLDSIEQGAWVIWERAAGFGPESARDGSELLCDALGLQMRRGVRVASRMYVDYRWPDIAMVRAFHRPALLDCAPGEVIAEYDGAPVAMKRAYGKGGIVFLGSMLGPGIRAGEPEARQVAQAFFRGVKF